MFKYTSIDLNTPRVEQLAAENAAVFRQLMDNLVASCNIPGVTQEEHIALIIRSAIAYSTGVCQAFNIKPAQFAELIHMWADNHKPLKIIQ